jgi:hypothetical protein
LVMFGGFKSTTLICRTFGLTWYNYQCFIC